MVARGDLGVELGVYRCPFAQKLLITKAKAAGLFVINATQIALGSAAPNHARTKLKLRQKSLQAIVQLF
eukprot:2627684-Amphidinium_carterae.1